MRHVYFVGTFFSPAIFRRNFFFDPTKNCFFHDSIWKKIAFITTRSNKKLLFPWLDPTKNCFSHNQFRRKIVFVTIGSDEKLLFPQTDPTKNCFCKFYVENEKSWILTTNLFPPLVPDSESTSLYSFICSTTCACLYS